MAMIAPPAAGCFGGAGRDASRAAISPPRRQNFEAYVGGAGSPRARREIGQQAPAGADPGELSGIGRERQPAIFEGPPADERQRLLEPALDLGRLGATLQVGELRACRSRDPRPAHHHCVPGQVLQGQADDEQDELELGRRDEELAVGPGRAQEDRLERHPVALREVVADDELKVRVYVDHEAGLAVVPVVVEDSREPLPSAPGQLEAQAMHNRREAILVHSRDQQVQVVLAGPRAIKERVALEVAPRDLLGRQLSADIAYERDRARPTRFIAFWGGHCRSGVCRS